MRQQVVCFQFARCLRRLANWAARNKPMVCSDAAFPCWSLAHFPTSEVLLSISDLRLSTFELQISNFRFLASDLARRDPGPSIFLKEEIHTSTSDFKQPTQTFTFDFRLPTSDFHVSLTFLRNFANASSKYSSEYTPGTTSDFRPSTFDF